MLLRALSQPILYTPKKYCSHRAFSWERINKTFTTNRTKFLSYLQNWVIILKYFLYTWLRKGCIIWGKVFKNGPSKIRERQTLKNFTWSFLEYFVPDNVPMQTSQVQKKDIQIFSWVMGIMEISRAGQKYPGKIHDKWNYR